jgi:hypothetical protein
MPTGVICRQTYNFKKHSDSLKSETMALKQIILHLQCLGEEALVL